MMDQEKGRFGKDICTMPPGCGWNKPIVHIGKRDGKEIKLCEKCFEAVSPQPKALDPIEWEQKQAQEQEPEMVTKVSADWNVLKMFAFGMFYGAMIGVGFAWLIMRSIS